MSHICDNSPSSINGKQIKGRDCCMHKHLHIVPTESDVVLNAAGKLGSSAMHAYALTAVRH